MDLNASTEDQLKTLIEWLRLTANQETPAPVIWAQIQKGMRERAQFTETFILPNLTPADSFARTVPVLPRRPDIKVFRDQATEPAEAVD